MNLIDKLDVEMEIFLDRLIFRIWNDEKLVKELVEMYKNKKPDVVPYILSKFNKKKCPYCNGRGFT